MTLALVVLCAIGWSWWFVASNPTRDTTAGQQNHHEKAAARIEEDSEQYGAAHGEWTALDELQLIRLLSNHAP